MISFRSFLACFYLESESVKKCFLLVDAVGCIGSIGTTPNIIHHCTWIFYPEINCKGLQKLRIIGSLLFTSFLSNKPYYLPSRPTQTRRGGMWAEPSHSLHPMYYQSSKCVNYTEQYTKKKLRDVLRPFASLGRC